MYGSGLTSSALITNVERVSVSWTLSLLQAASKLYPTDLRAKLRWDKDYRPGKNISVKLAPAHFVKRIYFYVWLTVTTSCALMCNLYVAVKYYSYTYTEWPSSLEVKFNNFGKLWLFQTLKIKSVICVNFWRSLIFFLYSSNETLQNL